MVISHHSTNTFVPGLCDGFIARLNVSVASCVSAREREERFSAAVRGFGEDAKNRYIPRISRDFSHFLAFEGNADELGPQPVSTTCEERKRAIEVAAAHTNAVHSRVEYDEGSDDNVEFARIDQCSRYGFPETEIVSREVRSRQCFSEKHSTMRSGYRQEYPLFCAPCALDNCTCIYLVPG